MHGKTILLIAIVFLGTFLLEVSILAQPPRVPSPNEGNSGIDPRSTLLAYFKAISLGNKEEAVACWLDDTGEANDASNVVDLVNCLIDDRIAQAKLVQIVFDKLPNIYVDAGLKGQANPSSAVLSSANCLIYHKLAFVKWGEGQDEGCVLTVANGASSWKISMKIWHDCVGTSVGDSMLRTKWEEHATNLVIEDIIAGKITNTSDFQKSVSEHSKEAKEPDPLLRTLKRVALAMRLFANDHDGMLPISLSELVPQYTSNELKLYHPELIKPGAILGMLPPNTIILEGTDAAGNIGEVRADDSRSIRRSPKAVH